MTTNQTAWGSREGADENDAYRMIHISQAQRERGAERQALEIITQ